MSVPFEQVTHPDAGTADVPASAVPHLALSGWVSSGPSAGPHGKAVADAHVARDPAEVIGGVVTAYHPGLDTEAQVAVTAMPSLRMGGWVTIAEWRESEENRATAEAAKAAEEAKDTDAKPKAAKSGDNGKDAGAVPSEKQEK